MDEKNKKPGQSNLLYISRNGKNTLSSDRWATKVYVSYHPKDYHLLDQLFSKLLEMEDFVIYYLDYQRMDELDKDELNLVLDSVELCVFFVSEQYLNDETCFSYSYEFKYLHNNQVKVLPLLNDETNIDKYTDLFGTLQYYVDTDQNDFSIKFDRKLDSFLKRYIIQHHDYELASKAFSKRIFLSYRKKDRKYALKLMDAIHKNPEMQNVAIWYDEFLVGGESFDEAINQALIKSDVFVLLVTPNLVNEDNYVRRVEYKKAHEEYHKKIVPVMMKNTDIDLLKSWYDEIPDCVNENMAAEAILSQLEDKKPIDELTNEDKYALGLAYLHGVEVEVNRILGSHYIELAAISEDANIDTLKDVLDLFVSGLGSSNRQIVANTYLRVLTFHEHMIEDLINYYPDDPISKHEVLYTSFEDDLKEYAFRFSNFLQSVLEGYISCDGDFIFSKLEKIEEWKKLLVRDDETFHQYYSSALDLLNLISSTFFSVKQKIYINKLSIDEANFIVKKFANNENYRDLAFAYAFKIRNVAISETSYDLKKAKERLNYCINMMETTLDGVIKLGQDLTYEQTTMYMGIVVAYLSNYTSDDDYDKVVATAKKAIDYCKNKTFGKTEMQAYQGMVYSYYQILLTRDQSEKTRKEALANLKEISDECLVIKKRDDVIYIYCNILILHLCHSLHEYVKFSNTLEVTKQWLEQYKSLGEDSSYYKLAYEVYIAEITGRPIYIVSAGYKFIMENNKGFSHLIRYDLIDGLNIFMKECVKTKSIDNIKPCLQLYRSVGQASIKFYMNSNLYDTSTGINKVINMLMEYVPTFMEASILIGDKVNAEAEFYLVIKELRALSISDYNKRLLEQKILTSIYRRMDLIYSLPEFKSFTFNRYLDLSMYIVFNVDLNRQLKICCNLLNELDDVLYIVESLENQLSITKIYIGCFQIVETHINLPGNKVSDDVINAYINGLFSKVVLSLANKMPTLGEECLNFVKKFNQFYSINNKVFPIEQHVKYLAIQSLIKRNNLLTYGSIKPTINIREAINKINLLDSAISIKSARLDMVASSFYYIYIDNGESDCLQSILSFSMALKKNPQELLWVNERIKQLFIELNVGTPDFIKLLDDSVLLASRILEEEVDLSRFNGSPDSMYYIRIYQVYNELLPLKDSFRIKTTLNILKSFRNIAKQLVEKNSTLTSTLLQSINKAHLAYVTACVLPLLDYLRTLNYDYDVFVEGSEIAIETYEIAKDKDYRKWVCSFLVQLAKTHLKEKNSDKALEVAERAVPLFEEEITTKGIKNTDYLIDLHVVMGNAFLAINSLDDALGCFKEALEVFDEQKLVKKVYYGEILAGLSKCNLTGLDKELYDNLSGTRTPRNIETLISSYRYIVDRYLQNDDEESAIYFLLLKVDLLKESFAKEIEELKNTYLELSSLYNRLGQIELANKYYTLAFE